MSVKGVSLPVVAATGIGALFIWSGIKGASISGSLRDLLSGKQPSGADANEITGQVAGGGETVPGAAAGASSGSAVANDALQYVGHAYHYGGAPGTSGASPWDCSSFCNWVIGHDLQMAIPGYAAGKYTGALHGPPTGSWLIWSGAVTINKADIRAGDLLVWQTHMGIAVSATEMVSALNPSLGTKVTTFAGGAPAGEVMFARRLKAVTATSGGGVSTGSGGGTLSANQLTGRLLAGTYGWGAGKQWTALNELWIRESGWRNTAQNTASGAYGIPQALPYTKMPKSAWPASAGGSSNPVTQINWGLQYIKNRYGTPVAAWAHETTNGWY